MPLRPLLQTARRMGRPIEQALTILLIVGLIVLFITDVLSMLDPLPPGIPITSGLDASVVNR